MSLVPVYLDRNSPPCQIEFVKLATRLVITIPKMSELLPCSCGKKDKRKPFLLDGAGKKCHVCKKTHHIHEACAKANWEKVMRKNIILTFLTSWQQEKSITVANAMTIRLLYVSVVLYIMVTIKIHIVWFVRRGIGCGI